MAKIVLLCLISLLASSTGQRITTINLDGVQYFISRMNPYSPELNFFLAYQYCRSLGLQLASFETKEKSESIMLYLKNAGYSKYDFWTSGNRLGTNMFIWLSTGLPFNTTFNFFENSSDPSPIENNSNTSPQRTARDSSSGAQKDCVILKKANLEWIPEDCLTVKDFICEQTRCYYYNYGSIPVSSAQGRPITTTTRRPSAAMTFLSSTTPSPSVMSTYASFAKNNQPEPAAEPSFASLKVDHERALEAEQNDDNDKNDNEESADVAEHHVISNDENTDESDINNDYVGVAGAAVAAAAGAAAADDDDVDNNDELNQVKKQIIKLAKDEIEREHDESFLGEQQNNEQHQQQRDDSDDVNFSEHDKETETDDIEENDDIHSNVGANQEEGGQNPSSSSVVGESNDNVLANNSSIIDGFDDNKEQQKQHSQLPADDIPSVEQRLKKISQEIEKIASGESHVENYQHHHSSNSGGIGGDADDLGRQSFLSLTDLIRTLRPNDKQIPQIDSDYSNAMRVLGETSSLVSGNDESRKYKETESAQYQQQQQQQHQLNRALF